MSPYKSFADFSVAAGVGTAKFTTGFAGVNGTDSVDKMYTNSDVKFTRLGAGVDFCLSPTLILSYALMCNLNMMILVLHLTQQAPQI